MTRDEAWDLQARLEKKTKEESDKIIACLRLADFPFTEFYLLENRYWPKHPDYFSVRSPWYLFKTPFGLLEIGWRKRVISIDWEDFKARGQVVGEDKTTNDSSSAHAWTYEKLIEYLKELLKLTKENNEST